MSEQMLIDDLFTAVSFTPNPNQRAAILHEAGPLFLTAGPGSGKTRVLLWRTVNLIVCKGVPPERIFLSTFTEKAAHQLKEGLRYLLALATSKTGRHYDISGMAIGTVHGICRQMITDRRFFQGTERPSPVMLLDELAQYFLVSRKAWPALVEASGFVDEENNPAAQQLQRFLNRIVDERDNGSKHYAVLNAIKAFNRFTEESILPQVELECEEDWQRMRKLFEMYLQHLGSEEVRKVDLSLLQQEALAVLRANPESGNLFDHIIVDEYQDTNSIQEELFFHLAQGSRNITVVGDDDQALYRFRGATVENLVEFPQRCTDRLGVAPTRIDLNINYRSRQRVVDLYNHFIGQFDWRKPGGNGHYRVQEKNITAHRTDKRPSVVVTEKRSGPEVYAEIAAFIHGLKEAGKINDFSEVAVLFPSVKPFMGKPNAAVRDFKDALEKLKIPVYAPRAGRFLEVDESRMLFGLISHIIGVPKVPEWNNPSYQQFRAWISACRAEAKAAMDADPMLRAFVADKRAEVQLVKDDLATLWKVMARNNWETGTDATLERIAALAKTNGLSERAKRGLGSKHFITLAKKRIESGRPLALNYAITRATTVDWNMLDLFYQLCGFGPMRGWLLLAENGEDEGPVCNLSLISQYLARFQEEYAQLISAGYLEDDKFASAFFGSFCYALWRLGESEYENDDDPFPKGRVPFLTIHQSKGLEFKVVILGNLAKRAWKASPLEHAVRTMLKKDGEPLDKMGDFDAMRLFYVALSRAKDLLVLVEKRGGQVYDPLKCIRDMHLPKLHEFDLHGLPESEEEQAPLGRAYSFTGDYLGYLTCPRQYMVFQKYGFTPSRTTTRMFGQLVHRTIEDLHQHLIQARRREDPGNARSAGHGPKRSRADHP